MAKKKTAPPATRVKAIVSKLRKAAKGRYVWRCQNKERKSYCMEFEDWEQSQAQAWWENELRKFPEHHQDNELARVHFHTATDRLLLEAADMIERLSC